ncbi:aminotransferase class V-fold PLP-dependent enzyme [Pigmentiphaga soli]|uniref:Aminotransferase class V-fold PLP-dependent enzyme n=1 Tax=Pigmentiphaga soli TaxID=1007095 RepID=A0ABP8GKB5_9BURK
MTQPITAFRSHFPVFDEMTYIDVGSRSPLPKPTFDKLDAYLRQCMLGQIDKSRLFELTEDTRARFARLIHAETEEVTFTKNISEGLNVFSSSLNWQAGDNVIICPELEHPNNVYHWLALARRGVDVRTVAAANGEIPVDDIIARIDSRTRAVSVSTVTFCPGFRTNLKLLGQACRASGALLVVDAAQSIGILDIDVHALNVDVLAASTQKGLLALYGMGFLYVRRDLAEAMTPAYLARFSVKLDSSDSHESDLGDGAITFMPGAMRFDLGNYNFPAVVAVHNSLGLIEELGIQNIDRYVSQLTRTFATALREIGVAVFGREEADLAHTVSVGSYGVDRPDVTRLFEALDANKVRACMRRNMIRFTLHAYNNENDIDKVIEVASKTLRR